MLDSLIKTTAKFILCLVALILCFCFIQCFSKQNNSTPDDTLELNNKSNNIVTNKENKVPKPSKSTKKLSSPAVKKQPSSTNKNKPVFSNSSRAKKNCLLLLKKFQSPYLELVKRAPASPDHPLESGMASLVNLSQDSCSDKKQLPSIAKIIRETLDVHSGKIGVILPFQEPFRTDAESIVTGLKAAVKEAGQDPEKVVLVRNSRAHPGIAFDGLADLVANQQVSLIVGGISAGESRMLEDWANRLFVPTLILSKYDGTSVKNQFAFHVYPSEQNLANLLAKAAISRGWKNVAILRPEPRKADGLINAFKKSLEAMGGKITNDLLYERGNFDSIDLATKRLFKVETTERQYDYEVKYKSMKKQTEKLGLPFNPKSVILDPKIEMNAVFLPDDFQTVRHFVKIFKYHGVKQVSLLGNHEWRSEGLIQPYDDFLEGAIFADFIGSYQEIPRLISSAPLTQSSYFIDPKYAMDIDFKIIGYRTGKIAMKLLVNPAQKRKNYAADLSHLTEQNDPFFGSGLVFDKDKKTRWPTFLFAVKNGGIILMEKGGTTATPPMATNVGQSSGSSKK